MEERQLVLVELLNSFIDAYTNENEEAICHLIEDAG